MVKKSKLALVLGGTEDHIKLIENLKERGYFTVLVDYYDNPPAKSSADQHIKESTLDVKCVLRIAKKLRTDLIISTCIDQALLTVAYVSEELNLPCHISYKQALEFTNKAYMKRKMIRNSIPTSKFLIVDEKSYDKKLDLHLPVVVKPVDSNSSNGVNKVAHMSELQPVIKNSLSFSRSKKVIIEEFNEGREFSIDIIIRDSKPKILMVTENIKNLEGGNFTIVQNIYRDNMETAFLDQIMKIAQQISKAYSLKNSPLLLQLIKNKRGIYVIEFSPRVGGGSKCHFIERNLGFDVVEYFVDIVLGQATSIEMLKGIYKYSLINYVYALPGQITYFQGFSDLINKGFIIDYFVYKRPGVFVDANISSSDRLLGYMVSDNELSSLNSKLRLIDNQVAILDKVGHDIMLHNLFQEVS
jgi:biotin carboxylase